MGKMNLLGFDQDEMINRVSSLGESEFRGKQLYIQVYRRKQYDIEQMTDLAKTFRGKLLEYYEVRLPEIEDRRVSGDGAIKYLFRLRDGMQVESVYIPEDGRDTICISSQVGCKVGCKFCMTSQMGFRRNLGPDEIVGQVLAVIRDGALEEKGFNVVFMGMGEPLHNYGNVMKSFRLLSDPEGMGLSHRKITISTSGIVPVLRKMAEEDKLPSLAVSLNAADNETRNRIMPVNLEWNIEELLQACRDFPLESKRRITIEYVLLGGINDSIEDAEKLSVLLRGLPVKINLIAYNPNPGLPFEPPRKDRIRQFQEVLMGRGFSAFLRTSRGSDVAAACGQLAVLKLGKA
ncbi:MAG: 23S rRNA (adenine(2503)-C(2))-methyltransferase RlmN [Anaerolineales bacterium]|nr:23S rRNA (adenine(2503)-C(2))-methyltransferase RlmN [Anaerolineales bacterium]